MVTRALLKAAGISVMLVLGACAQTQTVEQAPAVVTTPMPATPSPRPECAPAHVTLYFTETVASDEPVVGPLLSDLMTQVRGCEAAGGELRGMTIIATADPGQNATEARAQVRRRQDRVRAALVDAGAPADKIHDAAPVQAAEETIMGRRADITVDMF